MDAICVFLSSFRAAKGRTCHDWTPAGCEPWATGGISLCLYCTMPMLCLRASQLYKLKQTFSFIDSIWLIFLNLSMPVCVCVSLYVCCVLSSLPWQRQTNIAVEAASLWKPTVSEIFSQSQPTATPESHDALYHPWPHATDTPDTDDSYLWLPALPKFPSLYCPH